MSRLDDLAAYGCRAAIERHSHNLGPALADFVVDRAFDWADRASQASVSIADVDPEMAQAVRRYARRRLRVDVRAALGREAPQTLKDATLFRATLVYSTRLLVRDDEHSTGQEIQS